MIYAIGDIHGQKDMLDQALALIEADGGQDAKIVFLGDYTDRGPDSKGVIETLIEGRNAGRNWTGHCSKAIMTASLVDGSSMGMSMIPM